MSSYFPSEDNESLLKLLLMNSNAFIPFRDSRMGISMKSDSQLGVNCSVERIF